MKFIFTVFISCFFFACSSSSVDYIKEIETSEKYQKKISEGGVNLTINLLSPEYLCLIGKSDDLNKLTSNQFDECVNSYKNAIYFKCRIAYDYDSQDKLNAISQYLLNVATNPTYFFTLKTVAHAPIQPIVHTYSGGYGTSNYIDLLIGFPISILDSADDQFTISYKDGVVQNNEIEIQFKKQDFQSIPRYTL